jgi:hypothetical protein
MLRITVDVFSGIPNPSWTLDEQQSKAVLEEISGNRAVVVEDASALGRLGYRGIMIEAESDETMKEYNLKDNFMIATGTSADERAGTDLARQLIKDMPIGKVALAEGRAPPDEELRDFLLEQVRAPRKVQLLTELDGLVVHKEMPKETCPYETCESNFGFWNNDDYVRQNNNCYNYARNQRTDTFAQPGRASGAYPYPVNCDAVTNGALSDGAHRRYDCFPESESPRWLMALVIWPGRDYHWYRKAREGFWGHKPGGTEARNTDNSGRVISDPEGCDRGPYTQFCGYFYACKSMIIE